MALHCLCAVLLLFSVVLMFDLGAFYFSPTGTLEIPGTACLL